MVSLISRSKNRVMRNSILEIQSGQFSSPVHAEKLCLQYVHRHILQYHTVEYDGPAWHDGLLNYTAT